MFTHSISNLTSVQPPNGPDAHAISPPGRTKRSDLQHRESVGKLQVPPAHVNSRAGTWLQMGRFSHSCPVCHLPHASMRRHPMTIGHPYNVSPESCNHESGMQERCPGSSKQQRGRHHVWHGELTCVLCGDSAGRGGRRLSHRMRRDCRLSRRIRRDCRGRHVRVLRGHSAGGGGRRQSRRIRPQRGCPSNALWQCGCPGIAQRQCKSVFIRAAPIVVGMISVLSVDGLVGAVVIEPVAPAHGCTQGGRAAICCQRGGSETAALEKLSRGSLQTCKSNTENL